MGKKAPVLDAKGHRKFSMRDNVAYAAGDFGCNMSFALKNTLFVFWTQFMGMNSLVYAALLVVVQIWDAINDPLIGSIIDADKHQYKRNKFLSYIFAGSIGLVVAGALCFVPLPNAPEMAKYVLFVAGYVIWDAFYTVANVPYGSLLGLISDDTGDRASLSAFRSVGSLVGNMIPMVILPFIIYDDKNNLIGERVFIAALIMGILGFFAFQFMIRNTEIRVESGVKINETEKFNVMEAIKNFSKNRPAIGATVAAMGMFVGMYGATSAVEVMFQSYFDNIQFKGIVSAFSMIPIILFTPLARKLVVKYGKKEIATAGSFACIAAGIGLVALPISPDMKGMVIYILCQLVFAIGMGIYSTVSWSMMGDAIDYNEWKQGAREEGTVYALHSFFRKLTQGLGPSIVVVIMVWLGYVEENLGNQTDDVALKMRYLVGVLYLLSAIIMYIGLGIIYNLDKKTTEQMKVELEYKRAEEA
ncbi:MAG: MFS transporter [Firmicutes bacterium]|nr:MFS transporter [Bacillota bacterium]MBR1989800.1 MFS transporter [Bacillota bacterium]